MLFHVLHLVVQQMMASVHVATQLHTGKHIYECTDCELRTRFLSCPICKSTSAGAGACEVAAAAMHRLLVPAVWISPNLASAQLLLQ